MVHVLPILFFALATTVALLPALVRRRVKAGSIVDGLVQVVLGATAVLAAIALTLPRGAFPEVHRIGHVNLFGFESALGLTVLIDRVSLVLLFAIAVVSLAVYRYSLRYLLGEAERPRFLGWLGFTIGAAQWLVTSGHLLFFSLSWILISIGLHHLLVHYPRPRAIAAARKKFLISRLGDAGLLFAIVVLASEFRTLDLGSLLEIARSAPSSQQASAMALAGMGLALAAICKSAQFPLHSWLPDTLEAPTPVSALMHAGIVNAGGFLLIRTSPLLAHADAALMGIVVIGASTAVLGTFATWAQTEVKRGLAWSTVSQMGFMILQCGLGAFALALAHLVGHGFYKAHAFLASGERRVWAVQKARPPAISRGLVGWGAGVVGGALALAVVYATLGVRPAEEPGGLVLLALVVIALSAWMVPNGRTPYAFAYRWLGLFVMAGLAGGVAIAANHFLAADLGAVPSLLARGGAGIALAALVIVLALATAVAGIVLPNLLARGRAIGFYLGSRHGFYVGLLADRLVQSIWPSRTASAEERKGS